MERNQLQNPLQSQNLATGIERRQQQQLPIPHPHHLSLLPFHPPLHDRNRLHKLVKKHIERTCLGEVREEGEVEVERNKLVREESVRQRHLRRRGMELEETMEA